MLQNVIVDTSVLVSAFLFPKSTPGRVLLLADQGVFAMYLSPIILEELIRDWYPGFRAANDEKLKNVA
jgi:predicted nucleic acid-binding protein